MQMMLPNTPIGKHRKAQGLQQPAKRLRVQQPEAELLSCHDSSDDPWYDPFTGCQLSKEETAMVAVGSSTMASPLGRHLAMEVNLRSKAVFRNPGCHVWSAGCV